MVLLAPHVGKSKSALMGSVTLPSSNAALMEEDRPGKTRKELRSEMLLGLSHWGIKRGRAAVTASRRLAPSSKAQHQNPTIFYISFLSAQLLHVCPGSPGSGNPKDPVDLLTSPGSAGVKYLE